VDRVEIAGGEHLDTSKSFMLAGISPSAYQIRTCGFQRSSWPQRIKLTGVHLPGAVGFEAGRIERAL